jgi:hypothetical protein
MDNSRRAVWSDLLEKIPCLFGMNEVGASHGRLGWLLNARHDNIHSRVLWKVSRLRQLNLAILDRRFVGGVLLCPQLQERQELGQVGEPFGFPPLTVGQLLTAILAIEQTVQALSDAPRKLEAFQVFGELELDEDVLSHTAFR